LIEDLLFNPYIVYREFKVSGAGNVSGACGEYMPWKHTWEK
jgi:hypothetical protein